ncbi:hypothetical protein M409DRAFT_30995 [Zasmidium cellare ATCC 36951]|uniref:GPR1/FUN34/YaaH-class plasma membrane protein n=1 Tax=Zasmidium cellare ATCC 36951 TaxID=1080233 RepID=A0A6A6BUX7_ZASCE|nr:uncharacterized protein M409DRAFT_30995 [Zasmidium cellare ATCC 36951]KAF2158495.1 hypothetical protein M409DRAFT_30995 [Zasmidium cellare ATCC 36951]
MATENPTAAAKETEEYLNPQFGGGQFHNAVNGAPAAEEKTEEYLNPQSSNGPDSARDMAAETLERIRTTNSIITITPEQFEKLYLQPQGQVKGDLRKTFGNPTPLALGGFVMGLTPLSCQLMGWRGSGQLGTATIGVFLFIGGPCLWVGGLLEFFLGNTFSFVVFFIYGGILFGWGATLQPFYNASGAYAPNGDYVTGKTEPAFWSSLAFWPLAAGMLSLVFMVGAVRINAVFMMVFFTVGLGFLLLAGAFWEQGLNDAVLFNRLCEGTGGTWFVTSLLGWYLLFVQIMDAVGFKWPLPVGDFSGYWAKREMNAKV